MVVMTRTPCSDRRMDALMVRSSIGLYHGLCLAVMLCVEMERSHIMARNWDMASP